MATLTNMKDRDRLDAWLAARVDRAEYDRTDWFNYQYPTTRTATVARPAAAPAQVSAPTTTPTFPAPNGLTEKQIKFLDDLLRERVHEYTEAQIVAGKLDWRKGRVLIDTLKLAPKRPWQPVVETLVEVVEEPKRERLNFSAIPDGYYALNAEGVVKFYRVSTHNGYKNVQAQASDNLFPVRGRGGIAVLHRLVEAGLEDSQKLYASELGRCYVCGRTLTDEASREAGIGPICASKGL